MARDQENKELKRKISNELERKMSKKERNPRYNI